MTTNKTKRTLRLTPENLLKISGQKNAHQLSLASKISAYTGYKYVRDPNKVKSVDLEVLFAILSNGAELSDKQILDLKIGDLFEVIEVDD